MPTRILEVVGYKCEQCNKVFDSKTEYVKSIEHGRIWNHTITSVQKEISEEEFEEQVNASRKKYFAEMNKFEISSENQSVLDAIREKRPIPKFEKTNERYGAVDI